MLSVVLYIASALMMYCAMLLAFASGSLQAPKWWIFGLFAGLGALLLLGGLSLRRFRTWRRDVGTVLLSASGIATMVALVVMIMVLDEEMMRTLSKHSESLTMFSDYVSGGGVIACAASLGWLLLRSAPTSQTRTTLLECAYITAGPIVGSGHSLLQTLLKKFVARVDLSRAGSSCNKRHDQGETS